MTIRRKLLLFIPLLVLLANSITFFLFQSGRVVNRSYDVMMDRILLYKQSVESAQGTLVSLYGYLIDPADANRAKTENALAELSIQQKRVADQRTATPLGAELDGYVHMMETLLGQEKAAMAAAGATEQRNAISRYEEAEQTARFIREEEQRLVDSELTRYQPVYWNIQLESGRMNRLGAAVFIVNSLLSVALAIWISRSITEPVGHLVRVATQVAGGNLQVEPPSPQSKDELGYLSGAFRRMIADLKISFEKEKELSEKDRLVKELELKTLQSQINPHFLFNTLNVLSKLALLENAVKTSDLIVSMSKLMRYNLRKLDKPVKLQDELEHVKAYMVIQHARFQDRVRFEIRADESVLQRQIPALTLQPLIENAFLHGIDEMEQGAVIRLEIAREPEAIRIEVEDNGKGMGEKERLAILHMEAGAEKKNSTGLGTRNVFRRLELFYGCRDMVDIRSEPGKGTRVTIRIPFGKESGQSDVPIDDRR